MKKDTSRHKELAHVIRWNDKLRFFLIYLTILNKEIKKYKAFEFRIFELILIY